MLAEGMAKLVMQRDANNAQALRASPCAEEGVAARLAILRVLKENRESIGDAGNALLRKHVCDGVGLM